MPIIRPDIFTTPDCPTVKFREDPELINLDIEIPKLLFTQGWGLGTTFSIQFINHERTKVIKVARFIVSAEDASLHTFNPDSEHPMTKTVETRRAKRIEGWVYPNGKPVGKPVDTSAKIVKWNPKKRKHEVKQGKKILFSSTAKEEAIKFRDAA